MIASTKTNTLQELESIERARRMRAHRTPLQRNDKHAMVPNRALISTGALWGTAGTLELTVELLNAVVDMSHLCCENE